MKYRVLLSAAVGIAAVLSWGNAHAQIFSAPSGPGVWYLGGEGGWTMLEDENVSGPGFGGTQRNDDGFSVGARGGYMMGPWRFEEELRWQRNGIRGIGAFPALGKGGINAYAIMTNAIYDFNLGSAFSPHLGVGIGAVGLNENANVALDQVHGTDWEFGYQAIAGVRYMVNPMLAFDLDYRYLATTDATFTAGPANSPVKTGYDSHSVIASLSMVFGAPPPPPPPVAAPVAAPAPPPATRRVFLVFFDWDRDTITPQGMQIIHHAADAYRSGAPVEIQVTGYTDRSGSAGYNQRLSERRANNVANAMVRFGVPRNQMAVTGRGENDNRVPTANGVREPQNRRVEIVFP